MLRVLAFVGPLVEAVAIAQQLRWHALHPDAEPFGNILIAHAGIYAGITTGALGAAAWLSDPRRERAAAVLLAGALLRLTAVAVDAFAHSALRDPSPGHALYRAGLWLGAAGLALGLAMHLAALAGSGRAARDKERGAHGDEDRERPRTG